MVGYLLVIIMITTECDDALPVHVVMMLYQSV